MIKVRITSKAGRTLKTDLPANIHALHHTLTEISFSHLQNMTQHFQHIKILLLVFIRGLPYFLLQGSYQT